MSKNVATVEDLGVAELVTQLRAFGFVPQNPHLECVEGFSSVGNGPIRLGEEDVTDFLLNGNGNGISFWRGTSEDVFVSSFRGRPRISFDGFTALQEGAFCRAFAEAGIRLTVIDEDSAYES
jgi:hypothetical protein